MQCQKCQYQIPLATIKICPNCGTQIETQPTGETQQFNQPQMLKNAATKPTQQIQHGNPKQPKRRPYDTSPLPYDNTKFQPKEAKLSKRFFAFVIDTTLVTIMSSFLAYFNIPFAGLLVAWLYYAGFHSSNKQATIGKQVFKIKVADVNGLPIRFRQASIRFIGRLLATISMGLGFLFIFFTQHRQGIHDFIAHTCVYEK